MVRGNKAVTTVDQLPDWERLLAAAASLQAILPEATLVGGTAVAIEAGHRRSLDADHVIAGLAPRFDEVLTRLEAAAGWQTKRRQRPKIIKGSLDGILTTVRNQIRVAPLEVREISTAAGKIRVPTAAEILRIKAWLVVNRNATRDFIDVAALSEKLGDEAVLTALAPMDRLYPQAGDPGAVRQQIIRQLAEPRPYDLDDVKARLSEYKGLVKRWQRWDTVVAQCRHVSLLMGGAVASRRSGWNDVRVR